MTFWINGNFQDELNAIAINDRGFLLGDGLFETFYVENGKACEVAAHLDRLFASLDIMDIDCPYSKDELTDTIQALLEKNGISLGSLRLTISRGTGPRGLIPPTECNVTVLLTCAEGKMKRNEFAPIKLAISSIRRNDTSPASRMKTLGGYLDNILALKEAQENGADDAILLNTQGHIACTSSANIFLKISDIFYTPAKADGILPGIYRDIAINDLREKGDTVIEKSLTIDDLRSADNILITNSLIGKRHASLCDSTKE